MSELQHKLQEIARTQCLPYLLQLPRFEPYLDRLSFILVGSAATGLCNEKSDVDIAVVCDQEIYDVIAKDTRWASGRPSQVRVGGVQLHYYGISFEKIESLLEAFDDSALYVYDNFVVLRDPGSQYTRRFSGFSEGTEVRAQRIEGKLDMLLRRFRAWTASLEEKDLMATARLCLELITLSLKVIALLDDMPFDPQKRLMNTALRGELGQQLEERIRQIFSSLGDLGSLCEVNDFVRFSFAAQMENLIAILSDEARKQGYQVGLESPDIRHMEK